MKRNNSLALLAMLIAGATVVSGAYAFGPLQSNEAAQDALAANDYDAFIAAVESELPNRFTEERFESMAERYQSREAVQEAIKNNDYNAWVAAVEAAKPPSITELITEDNFGTFVLMHEAMQEGDFDTAQQLASELGIENRGAGMQGHMGKHRFNGGNCPGN